ncbi:MAG: phage tail protein [Lachnospiraceae bacterium]|nr:phage tail protein [Lachnospiraceae bacterium]
MIQVYNRDNTDYTKNGDCVLFPEVAEVHVVLNGAWEGKLEHPLDKEGRWKYLTEEAVVKMPSFNGDQLFRIRKPYKTDVGVSCTMEPIFYDCRNDTFLVDVRPERKNGQEALNILCTGKYRGLSDILTQSTAYYEYKNLLEALVGDQDNSFLNRWGGEVIFDNYTISINSRAGGDYNVEIRYGKNLPENGMSVELDMAKVTTRIYPKAYNGYMMTNHGYVDSPLINNYALIYAKTITFSDVKMREDAQEDDELNGIIVCDSQAELDAALRTKCLEEYDAGADKPELTIEADLILLQNTEQYADIADLESVSLGDTIHCYNNHLGITTNARVVELTYNSLEKRVENVTLGSFQESYFDTLTKGLRGIDELAQRANSALGGDGSIIAEKIKGVLNGSMAMIRTQYNIAERQDVMAILFENLDPTSDTYGALGIGTQGIMISKTRNQAGTDWVWTTAITALGIVADTIVTGLLSSADGKAYFDLDNNVLAATMITNNETLRQNVTLDTGLDSSGSWVRGYLKIYNQSYQNGMLRIAPGYNVSGNNIPVIAGANGLILRYGTIHYASTSSLEDVPYIQISDDEVRIGRGTTAGGVLVVDDNGVTANQKLSATTFETTGTATIKTCYVTATLYVRDQPISSSDIRLKKNVDIIEDCYLKAIGSVQIVEYEFRDQEGIHFGAVAQDVIESLEKENLNWRDSSIVKKAKQPNNDEEYYALNYTEFLIARIAHDEKAIQQQKEEIDSLKLRVEKLEKLIERMGV